MRIEKGFLVGITGNSGCGQTIAAGFIKSSCSGICSLDRTGHRMLERRYVVSELSEKFSRPDFIHLDGEDLRAELRMIVFDDSEALALLNSVLHPRMTRWALQTASILRKRKGIWLLEGALICELGIHEYLDYLIVIRDSEDRCVSRVAIRDMISEDEAGKRWRSQMPIKKKVSLADAVVNNSGRLDNMKRQIRTIFDTMKENLQN